MQLVRELVTPYIKKRMKSATLQKYVLTKIHCYLGKAVCDNEEEEEEVAPLQPAAAAVEPAPDAVVPDAAMLDAAVPGAAAPGAAAADTAAPEAAAPAAAELRVPLDDAAVRPRKRCFTCHAEAANSAAVRKLSTVNNLFLT